jgi:hypothetical protein
MVSTFPETSPWREHADFKLVVSTWAESLLKKARVDSNEATRRATLTRILADPKVDASLKKQATDLMTAPEPAPTPTDLPTVAVTKDAGAVATIAPVTPAPAPPPTRTTPTSHTTVTNATTSVPTSAPPPAPKPTVNALEKAREAALRGEPVVVRQHLEQKVRSGHGTAEEANLVRQACKAMGDKACSEDIKSKYP